MIESYDYFDHIFADLKEALEQNKGPIQDAPIDTLQELTTYIKKSKPAATIQMRICLRYDTEANWRTCPDFVPLKGEVCIVETDYQDWGYKERKIIIGNGESCLLSMLDNGHYLRI